MKLEKVNCIAEVEADSFTKDNYMTTLDRVDLFNIKNKVSDFLDSGEEFW